MMRSALKTAGTTSLRNYRGNGQAIGSVRFMGGKELKFGIEGRAAMLKGVDLLADAVQVSCSLVVKSLIPGFLEHVYLVLETGTFDFLQVNYPRRSCRLAFSFVVISPLMLCFFFQGDAWSQRS